MACVCAQVNLPVHAPDDPERYDGPLELTFQVDATALDEVESMGLRGGTPPLSWEQSVAMRDPNNNGFWEATVTFEEFPDILEFKFILNEEVWELGTANRLMPRGWTRMLKEPMVWDRSWGLPPGSEPPLERAGLQQDLDLLKDALHTMHPAPERYLDEDGLEGLFSAYGEAFAAASTREDAFFALSRLVAQLRCGHTHVSPFNQPSLVQQMVLQGGDKLPFAFCWVDGRAFVTRPPSPEGHVPVGSEITSINGMAMADLRDTLLTAVKRDGSNVAQALEQLTLTGLGPAEAWDALQPIVLPPDGGMYRMVFTDAQGAQRETMLAACSREERRSQWTQAGVAWPAKPSDSWSFDITDDGIGILVLGTFNIWAMDMDWRAFLDQSFQKLRDAGAKALVLDIRDNEGGADEVLEALAGHLYREDAVLPGQEVRLAYQTLPERLSQHAYSWNDAWRDWGNQVVPTGDGRYTWKKDLGPQRIQGQKKAYAGPVYALIGPRNSSATFYLARSLKATGRATLAGTASGGNLRGINGGQVAFFELPHSGLEVDIPLVGSTFDEQADGGVQPDWRITPTVDAARAGVDGQLAELLRRIRDRD